MSTSEPSDEARASGLTEGKAEPMEDERIEARWFTSKEIERGIRSGRIIDGKTMIGYCHWKGLRR